MSGARLGAKHKDKRSEPITVKSMKKMKIVAILGMFASLSLWAAENTNRPPAKLSPAMRKYDKNHDGKLDKDERAAFIAAAAKSKAR